MYSDIVKDHFSNPRNVGILSAPDAKGTAHNEADGDCVQLHLQIQGEIIQDVKMKVMGCVAAIAAASMLTVMIRGQSLTYAYHLKKSDLVTELAGLPEQKIRCSLTCLDALKSALKDYHKAGQDDV